MVPVCTRKYKLRLEEPPHKHKQLKKGLLCYSMLVCSGKIALFSSVYAMLSIKLRSFATLACVFVFKVLNTCDCGRFPSIRRIEMVQMFLTVL